MKKVKFKINGMHCDSCSLLIEEKLKNLAGVIQAKVSYESEMGVIAYDENVIKETEIKREIEGAGEYHIEKIKGIEDEKNIKDKYFFVKFREGNNLLVVSIITAGLIIGGAIFISK